MQRGIISFFLLLTLGSFAQGPYSPVANKVGSTAIHKDSSVFKDWATTVSVTRGRQNIADKTSDTTSVGSWSRALNKADGIVVSLGDAGQATVQFNSTLYNGIGPDFAVFENGFGSGSEAFVELAFVEVSSDGINFFRFPAISEEQTLSQKEAFDNSDATFFHNLAGKHIVNYGTPFDLADLPDTSALDKQNVTHIKVIDVIGNIDSSFASVDHNGTIINDPWPSNFPQGGFDLDAVGIINSRIPLKVNGINKRSITSYVKYDLNGKVISADQIDSYRGIWISADSKGVKLR